MAEYQSTMTFITESLPAFTVGETYDFALEASGGSPPYNFEITQGALPDGIDLSSSGIIAGVATQVGDTTVFIKVTDSQHAHLTQAFDCQVMEAVGGPIGSQGPLTFITESLPAFTADEPYEFNLEAIGGTPPYSFVVTQGALPDGIALSLAGKLSGTATEAGDTTAFVKLSDAAGSNLTQAFDCQIMGA